MIVTVPKPPEGKPDFTAYIGLDEESMQGMLLLIVNAAMMLGAQSLSQSGDVVQVPQSYDMIRHRLEHVIANTSNCEKATMDAGPVLAGVCTHLLETCLPKLKDKLSKYKLAPNDINLYESLELMLKQFKGDA